MMNMYIMDYTDAIERFGKEYADAAIEIAYDQSIRTIERTPADTVPFEEGDPFKDYDYNDLSYCIGKGRATKIYEKLYRMEKEF